jgi:hypothetical protein
MDNPISHLASLAVARPTLCTQCQGPAGLTCRLQPVFQALLGNMVGTAKGAPSENKEGFMGVPGARYNPHRQAPSPGSTWEVQKRQRGPRCTKRGKGLHSRLWEV